MVREVEGERRKKLLEYMYLLDTDIVIWLLRGKREYIEAIQKIKAGGLAISAITVAEVYKNVLPGESIKTEEVLSEFEVLDLNMRIARQAGLYWQQYFKKDKDILLMDCSVAAIAKEHDLTLLSLNKRHFPMEDIKVIDPGEK